MISTAFLQCGPMTQDPPSRRIGVRTGERRTALHALGLGARTTVLAATLAAGLAAGCDPTPTGSEATADGYRSELAAICVETAAALDALPTPPEQIPVAEFAVDAASILTAQAEQVRRLAVPDELADDHRAFVRNTEDQAAGWRAIADSTAAGSGSTDESAVADSDLAALTTRIGELQLGRDDLATEMAVTACRRTEDG